MSTYNKLAGLKHDFTKTFMEDGTTYKITATAELTDYFSLTGNIWRKAKNGRWVDDRCGCIHDDIAKHFPELRPYIKWHLCGTEQPLHYLANTLWHAGDKDCHGLREGETRQIINGRTGEPCWQLQATLNGEPVSLYDLQKIVDSEEKPEAVPVLEWVPLNRIGQGKARDFDAARSTAIWPEATDEELMAPDLKEKLEARLPALVEAFHEAMNELFKKEEA